MNLKQVIMQRDELTSKEADELISEARGEIMNGEDPVMVLEDFFGLEPDYIFDILP
jgi:hypothetical protein